MGYYPISNHQALQFKPLNAESATPQKIYGSNKLKQEGISAAKHVSNSGIKPTSHDPETAKPIKNHETTLTNTADLIKSVKKSLNKISFSPAQQKVSKFKAVALIVIGLASVALAFTGLGAPIALGLVIGGLFFMGAGFHMKDEINTTNKGIAAHNEDITTFPKDPPISSKMKFHTDVDPSIKEKLVDLTKSQIRLKHAQNFLNYLTAPENRDKNFKEQLLNYNNSLCDFLGDDACDTIGISKKKISDKTETNVAERHKPFKEAFKNIQKFIEFQKDNIEIELNLLQDAVLDIENNKADEIEKAENAKADQIEKAKAKEIENKAKKEKARNDFFEDMEYVIISNIEITSDKKGSLLKLLKSCENKNMDVPTVTTELTHALMKGTKIEDRWRDPLRNEMDFIFKDYSDEMLEIDGRGKYSF